MEITSPKVVKSSVDAATGNEAKWIKAYNMLQYNSMFDEKNRNATLFPYLE